MSQKKLLEVYWCLAPCIYLVRLGLPFFWAYYVWYFCWYESLIERCARLVLVLQYIPLLRGTKREIGIGSSVGRRVYKTIGHPLWKKWRKLFALQSHVRLQQYLHCIRAATQRYNAWVLANDMAKYQIFVAEMTNWMDVFYQELLTTSEASEEEAWELVIACIKTTWNIYIRWELYQLMPHRKSIQQADSSPSCGHLFRAI